MPSDPTAAALFEFLEGRHREFAKQIEGVDEAGVNWRPGPDTNSIFEMVNHALDAERGFVTAVAGASVTFERRPNVPGTAAQALDRIRQADADLATYLNASTTIEVGQEIQFYRRSMSAALALSLGIGHVNEHLGQLQLTRQLWDQYGKTGVLSGWQREATPAG